MDRLIPIGQAKEATGLGRVSLYRYINRGQLTALRIGSRTFIKQSEADRFVRENGAIIGRDASATGKGA